MLYQGKILDGRRRYRALKQLGKEPRYVKFNGGSRDALDLSYEKNLHRRNLDTSQIAIVKVAYLAVLEEMARGKIATGKSEDGKAGGRGRKKNPVRLDVTQLGGGSRDERGKRGRHRG